MGTGRGKAEPPPTRVFTDAHMFTDEGTASNAENDLEDDADASLTMNTAEIVDGIDSMDNYEIGDMDEGVSDDDLLKAYNLAMSSDIAPESEDIEGMLQGIESAI